MFSPSAIADFLACQHLSVLNRAAKAGEIKKPYFPDPGVELLRKLGHAHEQRYFNQLIERGVEVFTVPDGLSWSDAAVKTVEAMRAGAPAIYQASVLSNEWYGRADFLLRVETPSELGGWSYEVVETKLARSTKARALIQLCFYSELVGAIQGRLPERMHVVLGGGAQAEAFRVERYVAYFRKVKREFEAALATNPVTYPEPVEHCNVCDWVPHDDDRRQADDHLSLIAGITRKQRKDLVMRRVSSVVQFATQPFPLMQRIEREAPAALMRIREQARVQVAGREQRRPVHELIQPIEEGKGLAALPLPSPSDVFLDFEGDPFAFDQGLEYLIGMVTIAEERVRNHENTRNERHERTRKSEATPIYESTWSFDPKQEKRAFVQFIEKVKRIRAQHPDMHIYHYAAYETTAIKHLAGRHGVCADEVDELLRAEVFVDLYRVVRQGLRASVESYSIKKMEPFYGFTRTVPLRNATSALQAFEAVLALGEDPASAREILSTIADYNRDDCISTWRLRDWLEELRSELEIKLGRSIARPEPKSGAPSDDLEAQLSEITVLKERLVVGLPEEESEWTNEQRACWLLAQLLEWHRREDKSMWWEYYRLCELSDDELIEDKNALGGLVYIGVVEETKKSFIHRYQFPFQDHTIDRALNVHDPRTKDSAGTLVEINEVNLTIDLKRGKTSEKPHPTALIPNDYVGSKKQVESLMRIAKWVAENGMNSEAKGDGYRQFQAARDALLRREPRITGACLETLTAELSRLEAARRLALALDCSILPIQGPPGSGKTYTGAQM